MGFFFEFFRLVRLNGFFILVVVNLEFNVEKIIVIFVNKDGEEKEIKVLVGMLMLEVVYENDIELEGVCEGLLVCFICYVIIIDEEFYNKFFEFLDEENDMLDFVFGLIEIFWLGC